MALWPVVRREFPSLLRHGFRSNLTKYFPSRNPALLGSRGFVHCSCISSVLSGQGRPLTGPHHPSRRSSSSSLLLLSSRGCANVSDNSSPTLPPLMKGFKPLIWPQIINQLRNWFFTYFVIRPYMDREFSLTEFDKGAREAVHIISTKLSKGELEDLEDLIEPSAFSEIKRNLAEFSVSQRELLPVAVEDIYFSYPHELGIILPDRPGQQQQHAEGVQPPQVRQVEITMVFHVMRGIAEEMSGDSLRIDRDFLDPINTQKRLVVCNYRFFRDFTEGKDPSWIVNMVNHFMPTEVR